jgi:hypothetical protein
MILPPVGATFIQLAAVAYTALDFGAEARP